MISSFCLTKRPRMHILTVFGAGSCKTGKQLPWKLYFIQMVKRVSGDSGKTSRLTGSVDHL